MARPKYKWTLEELQKLLATFQKHGWSMGYYTDFGCSYMTCYRKLVDLGFISSGECDVKQN